MPRIAQLMIQHVITPLVIEELIPTILYVYYDVLDSNIQDRVLFICPCGCGDIVVLGLVTSKYQFDRYWVLTEKNNKPSLSPSIHRRTGCNSHFILHKGIVDWL